MIVAPGVETVVVTNRSVSNDSHVLKNVVYLAIDQLNRNYAVFNELIQDNIQQEIDKVKTKIIKL